MFSFAGRFLKSSPASSGPGTLPAARLLPCRSLSQGGRPPMGTPHAASTSRFTACGLAAQSIGLGSSITDRRAFDLLHLDGEDLTSRPLVERKRSLDELQLIGPAYVVNGSHPGEHGDGLRGR